MQSEKKERRYFVRIMIVGKGRVGKTCLMRRLLKERIKKNEPSTDGVDIVVQRCKININDGKWTIGKGRFMKYQFKFASKTDTTRKKKYVLFHRYIFWIYGYWDFRGKCWVVSIVIESLFLT